MVLLPSSAAEGRTFGRVVSDLADAGVAAFLLAGDPDPDGLEAAEQAGAPVLRLAANASLVEAERSIISLIVDRESQLRRRVEHVYEQLLTTLVDDAGIGQLTSEVAEVTGRPAVVLDEYFRVFVTEPNDAATRALGRALGTVLAERDPRVAGAKATSPLRLAPHDDGVEALLVPLSLRGTPAGYLALGGEETISELDLRIAERAARVLGIELAKQRAVTEAQLRLQGDFLEDLLSGGYPSEEAMLARARWMGHDLTRPHVVLALAVDEPPPTATVESRRMRAADIVRTEVMRVAAGALVREQQGAFDVAIPQATPPDHAASLALAERVREQLERVLVGATVTVGVGRSHPGVRGLARAYREAEQALAVARALLGGGQTIHFEGLGVQRLLFQLRDNPELASFYEDMLGRLQAHDERQGAELVSTLEAFFDCHGNHVRTAQRLHLHRNTLLYRLDRVRQVLGVDLDDPEMRLALQVALKIGRVIGRRRIDGVATAAS
jgi:purine catabolism regulator